MPTLKGTEASLSYVKCLLYLVSSSTNVFIVLIARMYTSWKDLIGPYYSIQTCVVTYHKQILRTQDQCQTSSFSRSPVPCTLTTTDINSVNGTLYYYYPEGNI